MVFFGTTTAFGQRIVELSFVMEPNNNVRLSVQSLFFYGNGQTNFGQLYGHTMWQSNDTIKFNIYYNAPPAPIQYTGYVDTVEIGTVMPHSANALTVYPYFLTQITTTDWDTTAFLDPDSTILFPWTTSLAAGSSENYQIHWCPNPARDQISLVNGRGTEINGEAVIADITGRVVLTKRLERFGKSPVIIGTRDLPPGVYVLTVIESDKRKYTQRFIKQ